MKLKVFAAVAGVLIALGALGATVWAQGAQVLGVAHNSAPQVQFGKDDTRCQAYQAALAQQLGIDVAKLQAAQKNAIKAMIDQAVKDGKMTAERGAQAKQRVDAATGPCLPLGHMGPHKGPAGPGPHAAGKSMQAALDAAAKALNMTPAELRDALKSGKSIQDIAKSKNVDLQVVKNAVVNAEKAAIDQAVKDGKVTQAQADKLKMMVEKRVDAFLSHANKHPQKTR